MDYQKSHLPEQICDAESLQDPCKTHIEYAVEVWNPPASQGYWKWKLRLMSDAANGDTDRFGARFGLS